MPDDQAGFEKALTLALAALSGGGLVFESAGAPASPPGCSHEALVIDDELLSVVRRVARGVEVTDETLSVEVVAEAVAGPGRHLGARRTMELMETEFVYPRHADRASPDDWTEAGARDVRERAAERAREAPARHRPTCIDAAADRAIRERCPIRLDPVWTRKAAT